jgi:hypothetical protein
VLVDISVPNAPDAFALVVDAEGGPDGAGNTGSFSRRDEPPVRIEELDPVVDRCRCSTRVKEHEINILRDFILQIPSIFR